MEELSQLELALSGCNSRSSADIHSRFKFNLLMYRNEDCLAKAVAGRGGRP